MPPKRKKRSKSMPKQTQSQRQSVVVNIGTSKTKSKPRRSRGRGNLPPPSYLHNLAPTFVTQAPPTDYNPVIGAIQGLTAKLSEEPRIQNPVTPLSSTTEMASQTSSSQSAEQMAGEAALRRAGRTAGNLQVLTSESLMIREPLSIKKPPPSESDFYSPPASPPASPRSTMSTQVQTPSGNIPLKRIQQMAEDVGATRARKQLQEERKEIDIMEQEDFLSSRRERRDKMAEKLATLQGKIFSAFPVKEGVSIERTPMSSEQQKVLLELKKQAKSDFNLTDLDTKVQRILRKATPKKEK